MKTRHYLKILPLSFAAFFSCRNPEHHEKVKIENKSVNDSTFTAVYINFPSLRDTFLINNGKSYRFKAFELVNSDTSDYYLCCATFDRILFGFYSATDSNGVKTHNFSDFFCNYKTLKADSFTTLLISDTAHLKVLEPDLSLYRDTVLFEKRTINPKIVLRPD